MKMKFFIAKMENFNGYVNYYIGVDDPRNEFSDYTPEWLYKIIDELNIDEIQESEFSVPVYAEQVVINELIKNGGELVELDDLDEY